MKSWARTSETMLLEVALRNLLSVAKCRNGCKKGDMTCATRKAEAILAQIALAKENPLKGFRVALQEMSSMDDVLIAIGKLVLESCDRESKASVGQFFSVDRPDGHYLINVQKIVNRKVPIRRKR
jgi:hypothetical protein